MWQALRREGIKEKDKARSGQVRENLSGNDI